MTDQLIAKMQGAVRDYLAPETYVRKSPGGTCRHDSEVAMPHNHASEEAKMVNKSDRDRIFISDMIYFLDSAEHGTNQPG